MALSRIDSPPLWESFSRDALSIIDWPVDFSLSGTASLEIDVSMIIMVCGTVVMVNAYR